ncbi:MAG: tRNA (adenosine(37)-N6)-threonylcarbamoyltransferase complex dimerization subunit type 1 TsaB [Flavicella sp.]
MSYILNIETATKNCSVSIAKSGKLIALKEINTGGYSHAEKLHVFIEEVVSQAGIELSDLEAVCVGKGPGSYTGLRIGVSAAKGICFALEIPLIAVESLNILSHSVVANEGLIIPLLDARRMEVYSAVYNTDYSIVRETQAEIITSESFYEYLEKGPVYFVGDGAEKCKSYIEHKNADFIADSFPSAKEMCALSYERFLNEEFEDVAYFEPFYLKDFVGTKPKKRT